MARLTRSVRVRERVGVSIVRQNCFRTVWSVGIGYKVGKCREVGQRMATRWTNESQSLEVKGYRLCRSQPPSMGTCRLTLDND